MTTSTEPKHTRYTYDKEAHAPNTTSEAPTEKGPKFKAETRMFTCKLPCSVLPFQEIKEKKRTRNTCQHTTIFPHAAAESGPHPHSQTCKCGGDDDYIPKQVAMQYAFTDPTLTKEDHQHSYYYTSKVLLATEAKA